jgi:hypothetical protein
MLRLLVLASLALGENKGAHASTQSYPSTGGSLRKGTELEQRHSASMLGTEEHGTSKPEQRMSPYTYNSGVNKIPRSPGYNSYHSIGTYPPRGNDFIGLHNHQTHHQKTPRYTSTGSYYSPPHRDSYKHGDRCKDCNMCSGCPDCAEECNSCGNCPGCEDGCNKCAKCPTCDVSCGINCEGCSTCDEDCAMNCEDCSTCDDACPVNCEDCSTCDDTCPVNCEDCSTCDDTCPINCEDCSTCDVDCEINCSDCSTCNDDCAINCSACSTCDGECPINCSDCSTCNDGCEMNCVGCSTCAAGCEMVCTGCPTCSAMCEVDCTGCTSCDDSCAPDCTGCDKCDPTCDPCIDCEECENAVCVPKFKSAHFNSLRTIPGVTMDEVDNLLDAFETYCTTNCVNDPIDSCYADFPAFHLLCYCLKAPGVPPNNNDACDANFVKEAIASDEALCAALDEAEDTTLTNICECAETQCRQKPGWRILCQCEVSTPEP